jgi:hypothetical protein
MNTKRFYALAAERPFGQSLFAKILIIAAVLALLFASLPVPGALAAGGEEKQPWENVDLEKEWKNKLQHLRDEGLFYDQARFYPVDFKNSDDLARAWDLLHKHGFALKQANSIVFSHSGFDFKGDVTNERLAYDSLHNLGQYLHMMRGMRIKIAEAGYKVRLSK